MAEILEFGENPDRKVHRLIGVRRFMNPEDKKHAHFGNAKSEIPTRWKAPLWGQLTSFHHIGGRESELREFRGKEPIGI
jgi:hypothetical protein